jgi:hypothetical protein
VRSIENKYLYLGSAGTKRSFVFEFGDRSPVWAQGSAFAAMENQNVNIAGLRKGD